MEGFAWWKPKARARGSYSLGEEAKPINYKGLAIVFITNFIIGSIFATQWIASRLHYVTALGKPVFIYDGLPVYWPFKVFNWALIMFPYFLTNTAVTIGLIGTFIIYFIALGLPVLFVKSNKIAAKETHLTETLHGSARWAKKQDIIDSGIWPTAKNTGAYVGGWTDPTTGQSVYLRQNGPEHILVFAPTRSGKGVGLVLPTLLSWNKSCFVFDIKGENYALTAGYRKRVLNQYVLRFDPTDSTGTGARYNPLGEIRIGTKHEYADIDNLCLILADPTGKGTVGGDSYWIEAAQSLLTGVVTHLLYACKIEGKEPTLGDVYKMLTDPNKTAQDLLTEMLTYRHDPDLLMGWKDSKGEVTMTHPVVAAKARDFLNKPDKEAGSVLSTTVNAIKVFFDPILNYNVSNATFTLHDLMNADRPATLYVCITPANLSRLSSLIRVLITQIVTILADELKFVNGRTEMAHKHKMLLMLDEFPSLGAMEKFETALAFIAGYGLKAYLITQDITQLQKAYTDKESIMSNTHVKIAYAANKIETAKVISDMLGTTTVEIESTSRSTSKGGGSSSTSLQYQGRKLLTEDEVMKLRGPLKDVNGNIIKPGQMIIWVSGFAPVLGTQILYFMDRKFNERSKIPAPERSDTITLSKFTADRVLSNTDIIGPNGEKVISTSYADSGVELPPEAKNDIHFATMPTNNLSELLGCNAEDLPDMDEDDPEEVQKAAEAEKKLMSAARVAVRGVNSGRRIAGDMRKIDEGVPQRRYSEFNEPIQQAMNGFSGTYRRLHSVGATGEEGSPQHRPFDASSAVSNADYLSRINEKLKQARNGDSEDNVD